MIPAPILLITSVAALTGLFVAGTWAFSVKREAWRKDHRQVECPQNCECADLEVTTAPSDALEFLVTSEPERESRVTRCSRFGDAPVTCAQDCLEPQD